MQLEIHLPSTIIIASTQLYFMLYFPINSHLMQTSSTAGFKYCIARIYCEKKYLRITWFYSHIKFFQFMILYQDIHRRYMDPKMCASFNFANSFEIAKLRLIINSHYTVILMTFSMYCTNMIMKKLITVVLPFCSPTKQCLS